MRILVTGATGNVGRMVVDELLTRDFDDVRALTVDPERAALPAGVSVVRGFLGRTATLPAALDGVDVMYLAPHPATAFEVCRMAADAGVRWIVDMAGAKGDHWQVIEDAVEACGVPWTHLEPGEFMANALIWADQIRSGDEVRDACPRAVNAPVAQEDIAAVAAEVIRGGPDRHAGHSYELTGPEALSRPEKVAAIAAALGRPLTYVELTGAEATAQFTAMMGEYGPWYLDGLAQLAAAPQAAGSTVSDLLGRPAMTYAEWARRHSGLFR
ncbi:NmrA family NAD(P)-binding protein [Actinoplanes sp. NBRC 101535]|uniref:SDR family oxidoreductase n=1 Tax=Actinoplanes sp. NBRC 101535 TaxID=3032196 RepID=UPI0024A3DA1C|nr:NmrA family NAD(P)-binding protein [Actinoplanes sp. NBRC 101535]GLY03702.1 nucleotide-diphosphate-sugar epimerase [Actinoplanes sp. NBRC 101535]